MKKLFLLHEVIDYSSQYAEQERSDNPKHLVQDTHLLLLRGTREEMEQSNSFLTTS